MCMTNNRSAERPDRIDENYSIPAGCRCMQHRAAKHFHNSTPRTRASARCSGRRNRPKTKGAMRIT